MGRLLDSLVHADAGRIPGFNSARVLSSCLQDGAHLKASLAARRRKGVAPPLWTVGTRLLTPAEGGGGGWRAAFPEEGLLLSAAHHAGGVGQLCALLRPGALVDVVLHVKHAWSNTGGACGVTLELAEICLLPF
jgi:hypothetical protein